MMTSIQSISVSAVPICPLANRPRRAKRSIIWKYFTQSELNPHNAICKLCEHEVISSGNTTNCRDHLTRHHRISLTSTRPRRNEVVDSDPDEVDGGSTSDDDRNSAETNTENAKTGDGVGASTSTSNVSESTQLLRNKLKRSRQQQPLRKYVKQQCLAYGNSDPRKKLLDKMLVQFISFDFQPLSVVDDPGFNQLMYAMDPRYALPSRNTLRNRLIPEYFDEVQEQVNLILNKVQNIAITYDGWTSVANVSYLTVTGHFIYKNEFYSILLSIKPIEGAATAENLKNHVQNILSQYPRLSVVSAVTDNGANMLAACRDLQVKNLPCFAHTLQLVVNTAILRTKDAKSKVGADTTEIFEIEECNQAESAEISVYSILKKVKRIVNYFHNSPKKAAELKTECKLRGMTITTLIQSVYTRWNSSYDMLERFYAARDCINVILMRTENDIPLLTPAEIEIIPEILKLLKPFVVATEQMSGDKYETVSLIIPFTKEILTTLVTEKPTHLTNPGKIFRNHLISLAEAKLLPYETRTVPSIATILDPRFKEYGFYNPYNYRNAANTLREELKSCFESDSGSNISAPSTAKLPQQSKKPSLFSFLAQYRTATPTETSTSTSNTYSQAIGHLNAYLAAPIAEEKANVIDFWSTYEKCDSLKQIALKYMVVPATSVPAERIHSIGGNLISDKRSRLDPALAEKLIMINQNSKFVDIFVDV